MVGWLYIDNQVAAPVRLLETDPASGLITIEVAGKFVRDRAMLRGQTILEYRGWTRRRAVRCLGAEEVGPAMMIEAVDLGFAEPIESDSEDTRGKAEDWLVVDGQARCRVVGVRVGQTPGTTIGHCMFQVPLEDWRDLRIGQGAVLAAVGVVAGDTDAQDGSITPLLHCARDRAPDTTPPKVELIRLRERLRYTVSPIATDWGESTTLVVCRVQEEAELNSAATEH